MANLAPIAQLTVDYPHCDGLLGEPDGEGWRERFGLTADFAFTADYEQPRVDQSPLHNWVLGEQVIYLPELRAIAPRGYCRYADMALSDWTAEAGQVKTVRWAGRERAAALCCYGPPDPTTGVVGRVTSEGLFPADPALELNLLRWEVPPEHDQPGSVRLTLWGALGDVAWRLELPFREGRRDSDAGTLLPVLSSKLPGPDHDWVPQAVCQARAARRALQRKQPFHQVVRWEVQDGYFLLSIDDATWLYFDRDESGRKVPITLGMGRVGIEVLGHQALVHLERIRYPLQAGTCYAELYQPLPVPAQYPFPPTAWSAIVTAPPGTSVSVEGQEGLEGRTVQPRVRFSSSDPSRRALCYLVQMRCEPVISAGAGSPWQSQGRELLVAARGRVTDEWRGATCEATLELDADQAEALPAWRGNDKVQVVAGWDTDAGPVAETMFTGYLSLDGAQLSRQAQRPGWVRVALRATDAHSRLKRKVCKEFGSFGGWLYTDAFRFIAHCAGFPDSLVDTSAIVAADLPREGRLPTRGADPILQFAEHLPFPAALDMLATQMRVRWGVSRDGKLVTEPLWRYVPPEERDPPATWESAGYWVLDDDTTDADESVRVIDVFRSSEEAANCVGVILGRRGEESRVVMWDRASMFQPTSDFFLGDCWDEITTLRDDADPFGLALHLLGERAQRHRYLCFRPRRHEGLWPDWCLKVQASGLQLPQNAVFKVTEKRWSVQAGNPAAGGAVVTARAVVTYNQLTQQFQQVVAS